MLLLQVYVTMRQGYLHKLLSAVATVVMYLFRLGLHKSYVQLYSNNMTRLFAL